MKWPLVVNISPLSRGKHGKSMAKPWQNQETWQPNIMEFPVDIAANARSVSPKNRRQSSRQSTFARGERSGGVLLVGSVVSLMGWFTQKSWYSCGFQIWNINFSTSTLLPTLGKGIVVADKVSCGSYSVSSTGPGTYSLGIVPHSMFLAMHCHPRSLVCFPFLVIMSVSDLEVTGYV